MKLLLIGEERACSHTLAIVVRELPADLRAQNLLRHHTLQLKNTGKLFMQRIVGQISECSVSMLHK
ncbi:hypothetical protein SDC9_127100 [bioreactor metagenome]|uniref:Uncharacterized protein n=1 Tax=bioreactor metagenome TaxID=1076179 RepID=A0A645CT30_9ZZZZ